MPLAQAIERLGHNLRDDDPGRLHALAFDGVESGTFNFGIVQLYRVAEPSSSHARSFFRDGLLQFVHDLFKARDCLLGFVCIANQAVWRWAKS